MATASEGRHVKTRQTIIESNTPYLPSQSPTLYYLTPQLCRMGENQDGTSANDNHHMSRGPLIKPETVSCCEVQALSRHIEQLTGAFRQQAKCAGCKQEVADLEKNIFL